MLPMSSNNVKSEEDELVNLIDKHINRKQVRKVSVLVSFIIDGVLPLVIIGLLHFLLRTVVSLKVSLGITVLLVLVWLVTNKNVFKSRDRLK